MDIDMKIMFAENLRRMATDMLKTAINEKLAIFKMSPPSFEEFVEWYISVGEPCLSRFSGIFFGMVLPESPEGIVTRENKIVVAQIVREVKPEWSIAECLRWCNEGLH